ncbi:MAG: trypsin-like serine protease [Nitrospina sp.]|jgi:S1-C subfamily serine protease|nr:trypsin-like serine protease [Nitrospina sp.]MBT6718744.1 trypsin-like serine protease [Nitrospina sp.]
MQSNQITPKHLITTYGLNILFLLGLCFAGQACSVSQTATQANKVLVNKDAPIFDKRFQDISIEDINLENFWTRLEDVEESRDRDPVSIDNQTFARISESVKSAVVNIYTVRLEEKDANIGIDPNSLLPFNIPIVSSILDFVPFQVPVPFNSEGLSLGSGFLINEQGYILTNAHVISNAVDIRVVLSEEQKEYQARIIGIDRLSDTALIKIDPDFTPSVLPFGDSDAIRMGEVVLAMGNPLGFQHSVTSGLISAKERISPHPKDRFVNYLQTDSAINPGSSGGPLINLHGEVVGINTAIIQTAQLIGFAIPINTVKEVMGLLIIGETERGWFGASATPISNGEAAELGFVGTGGLLIKGVEKKSPAETSGLKGKDIIVEFNHKPVDNFVVFRRKLLALVPGQKINLTVFREGKTFEVTSTLIKKPKETDTTEENFPEDDPTS